MRNTTVLICGGSIAGPTLAYWLHRHGFGPTVVERAPGLRPGGQAIDIRGTALEVVDRMGILDEARQAATHLAGMSFVDADGTEVMRSTEATLTGGVIDNPDVEIMRDDLTGLLYRQTKDTVEYVFDDTITALVEDDNGVTVTFEYTPARRFDLVIGADGLHSAVRALTFGPEKDFLTDLGTYLSVFSTPNFLGLEHWETFHRDGEKMVGYYTARQNSEARGMFGFRSEPVAYDRRDTRQQMQLVEDTFVDTGWETQRLLKAMWAAPDFYFDMMSQVKMDSWSNGRVSLVGDAGYAASPLSGQGTSLALVGAYVLAAELKAAGGDHQAGFAAYESKLRYFVEQNQGLVSAADGPPAPEVLAAAATSLTLD
ncbi:FAD-binding protein [Fodinicola feengrottensis]|uniref:FAD-binding protein n=1 Tax=Fodinicola feengrottensis TaxID=435914 RepID=A0ABN2HCI0_9ACTN